MLKQEPLIPYAGTGIQQPHTSRAALWAFWLGVAMWALTLLVGGLLLALDQMGQRYWLAHMAGGLLALIVGALVVVGCLLGIVNGIEALRQPIARKPTAVTGLVLCTVLETLVLWAAAAAFGFL